MMMLTTVRKSPVSEFAVVEAYGTRDVVLLVQTLGFVAASETDSAVAEGLVL